MGKPDLNFCRFCKTRTFDLPRPLSRQWPQFALQIFSSQDYGPPKKHDERHAGRVGPFVGGASRGDGIGITTTHRNNTRAERIADNDR